MTEAAPAIDVYACMTPNVLKVFFMLGELDLPFAVRRVRHFRSEQFAAGFEALHPYRKLPVIVDHDGPGGAAHTVFESGAILFYLAEKTGRLFGEGAAERSTAMQWLMLQMSSVGPQFGQATYFVRNGPKDEHHARRRFLTQALRLCDVYDERLAAQSYLAGRNFSIADVATFPWLWRHPGMLGIDLGGYPHIQRWLQELQDRPGFKRVYGRYRDLVALDRTDLADMDPDDGDRLCGRGRWFREPDPPR